MYTFAIHHERTRANTRPSDHRRRNSRRRPLFRRRRTTCGASRKPVAYVSEGPCRPGTKLAVVLELMAGQPLVSVLTPVYNGEAYLEECIASVLAQTYTNWEYVIVDNASTDGTSEIIRRHAEKDARIRVHRNPSLVPIIRNHNIAVRQASPDARYVKFIYADDVLLPECLERMVG